MKSKALEKLVRVRGVTDAVSSRIKELEDPIVLVGQVTTAVWRYYEGGTAFSSTTKLPAKAVAQDADGVWYWVL